MALALVHAFSSGKADGTDNTLVQPSNWNAQHTLTCAGNSLLGNATGGNTAVGEVPCTAQGRAFLASATLADLIAAGFPFFSTGDVKLTLKAVADTGWIICNDGTIGNDTSGANQIASTALASPLFTLIWTNITNTWAPIQDSTGAATTRGGSAAADFAASKRLSITKMMGRALAISGGGVGLTSRALGQILGEENHTLTIPELPVVTPAGTVVLDDGGQAVIASGGGLSGFTSGTRGTANISGSTFVGAPFGANTPHNNTQPTSFLNAMIKL